MSDSKGIVPTFSGSDADWLAWKGDFESAMVIKGLADPLTTNDWTTEVRDADEVAERKKLSWKLYGWLRIRLDDENKELIENFKGSGIDAWKALIKKYDKPVGLSLHDHQKTFYELDLEG